MNQQKLVFLLPRTAALAAILVFCSLTASAQTVQIFNVADYGAVGNGVADDGPAFQSALDAIAEAGGGTLFVPAGLYLIKTPVTKDFSALNGGTVTIQGVPSTTEPAPPFAGGHELAESLDLVSEILPATGPNQSAFTITNLDTLEVEHLAFTGNESVITDAYITLHMSDIKHASIFHCEFYGISTFGLLPGLGGGNIVRATRSDLTIRQMMVLGSTANSGAYAPIVENIDWKGFSISESIFIDFGVRSFFGKMGLGAPLSWINFAAVAPRTPESSRREVVIRDTFFDEGGWIGITSFGHLWGTPVDPPDLIYISGIKMNVSNLGTAGLQFFDVKNVLVENSLYGWSHNTGAAIDLYRTSHAILDRLTCIAEADRIRTDDRTERLTVINSVYGGLDSQALTTTELQTAPEDDPVQYVKQQFVSILGRLPEPAAHFYWSDLLIRCANDAECLNETRADLTEYLESNPQSTFSLTANIEDENGDPISGATVTISGSQSVSGLTDSQGRVKFVNLPTTGTYTVRANKSHYVFTSVGETFVRPTRDVNVQFSAALNHYTIRGQVDKPTGGGIAGITVQLVQQLHGTITTTTDSVGNYVFSDLPGGGNFTVIPLSKGLVFTPANTRINNLSEDRTANFLGRPLPELLTLDHTDLAIVVDSVSFVTQPLSLFEMMDFSEDGMARVTIFARNLERFNSPSQVRVTAEDPNHLVYPLSVEFVGNISGQSWLKQINVKLLPALGQGRCVKLRVHVEDLESLPARVCFVPPRSEP
jgi:hypothetical protein